MEKYNLSNVNRAFVYSMMEAQDCKLEQALKLIYSQYHEIRGTSDKLGICIQLDLQPSLLPNAVVDFLRQLNLEQFGLSPEDLSEIKPHTHIYENRWDVHKKLFPFISSEAGKRLLKERGLYVELNNIYPHGQCWTLHPVDYELSD